MQEWTEGRGEQTQKSLATHAFSGCALARYPVFVQYLLRVKKACAQANLAAKDLSEAQARAIGCTVDALAEESFAKYFVADAKQGGGGIAINVNINEVISWYATERLGVKVSLSEVNRSQSTADSCATALRLSLHDLSKGLLSTVQQTAALYRRLSQENRDVKTLARTCLRDACPTTIVDFFGAFAEALERRCDRLGATSERLLSVNLGGTVIGSGEGASLAYREKIIAELREVVKLRVLQRPNLFDAAQHADDLADVMHELNTLALLLSKNMKDLRLLHSGPQGGFNQLELPLVVEGSSFFKIKNNPTLPETVLQCCFEIFGHARVVEACLEQGELDLNVFDTLAGLQIYEGLEKMQAALQNFNRHCLEGLTINRERCKELLTYIHPQKSEVRKHDGTRETRLGNRLV